MYQQVRSQMKTGDVIAFSGKGFVSNIIKIGTLSKISHVGMVLTTSFGGARDSVAIIESTTLSKQKDALAGDSRRGVQIHLLSHYVNGGYDGDIYWCPLRMPIKKENEKKMVDWLITQHKNEVKYDDDQVMKAGLDIWEKAAKFLKLDKLFNPFKNEPDPKELFCSEMLEYAYQIAYDNADNIPAEVEPGEIVEYYTKDCIKIT